MKKVADVLSKQLNLFYLALSFFTRLPVPKTMQYSAELLSQSSRYFSLIGLLLGIMLALSYYVVNTLFSVQISILLMMSFSLVLTGAFHEDGLADMADGFGGGYNKAQCLTIMKDSRIGTYGAVTLMMALALKFTLLLTLTNYDLSVILITVILSQSLSRAIAASLIISIPYVSEDRQSKSKPLATNQSFKSSAVLLIVGCLPLYFYPLAIVFICLTVLFVFRWFFQQWLMKKIGGFTGDCLGAAQQVAEILILLVVVCCLEHQLLGTLL
ncbi:MAG: adenosylcobinamide-GDP ribazoletransferase [Colwellia sp.]|nr:adenosylcobinamide-GDP ribazoletransferase [Colwellia sp.]